MPFLFYRPMLYSRRPMATIEIDDLSAYNDGTPRGYFAKHEISQADYDAVVAKQMTIAELAIRFPLLDPNAPLTIPKAVAKPVD